MIKIVLDGETVLDNIAADFFEEAFDPFCLELDEGHKELIKHFDDDNDYVVTLASPSKGSLVADSDRFATITNPRKAHKWVLHMDYLKYIRLGIDDVLPYCKHHLELIYEQLVGGSPRRFHHFPPSGDNTMTVYLTESDNRNVKRQPVSLKTKTLYSALLPMVESDTMTIRDYLVSQQGTLPEPVLDELYALYVDTVTTTRNRSMMKCSFGTTRGKNGTVTMKVGEKPCREPWCLCREVEGAPVPRYALRIVNSPNNPRLSYKTSDIRFGDTLVRGFAVPKFQRESAILNNASVEDVQAMTGNDISRARRWVHAVNTYELDKYITMMDDSDMVVDDYFDDATGPPPTDKDFTVMTRLVPEKANMKIRQFFQPSEDTPRAKKQKL